MPAPDSLRIPVLGARAVAMRLSPLPRSGSFNPDDPASWWRRAPLVPDGDWWQIDLAPLGLPDGSYEYDFQVERDGQPSLIIPDPYAEESTRFGGYRAVLHWRGGHRYRLPFSWDGEIPGGTSLPNNNEMALYELPMRWVDAPNDAYDRQVGLGTFDKALFEHLDKFRDLGINGIELLPIQDSPDTLNWGYGTRFFFAPDLDMGEPFDLKLFVKEAHRRGIRIILDVVMNHSRSCPLEALAADMFYLQSGSEEPLPTGDPRPDWAGKLFRYRDPRHGQYYARALQYDMAEFWIRDYHIDGFRIDEFMGINNWDFIHAFRDHAWQVQQSLFPGRPFLVIAEDSWRRAQSVHAGVVDAIWDFDFRDELRRLVANRMDTIFGQPSRSERTRAMLIGDRLWNDGDKRWREAAFSDMAQRVTYCTSHDVQNQNEERLLPYFAEALGYQWPPFNPEVEDPLDLTRGIGAVALEQVCATFAMMLTTAGIPMFLSGEEFGDLHDTAHSNWRMKMSDPVNWRREQRPGHQQLRSRVRDLLHLRTRHPALQRDEVAFFGLDPAKPGFHPDFDNTTGVRVFAYCRTGGSPLGSPGQIIVVANCGPDGFPLFGISWPWAGLPFTESGGSGQPAPAVSGSWANLALDPFQVRVFAT